MNAEQYKKFQEAQKIILIYCDLIEPVETVLGNELFQNFSDCLFDFYKSNYENIQE